MARGAEVLAEGNAQPREEVSLGSSWFHKSRNAEGESRQRARKQLLIRPKARCECFASCQLSNQPLQWRTLEMAIKHSAPSASIAPSSPPPSPSSGLADLLCSFLSNGAVLTVINDADAPVEVSSCSSSWYGEDVSVRLEPDERMRFRLCPGETVTVASKGRYARILGRGECRVSQLSSEFKAAPTVSAPKMIKIDRLEDVLAQPTTMQNFWLKLGSILLLCFHIWVIKSMIGEEPEHCLLKSPQMVTFSCLFGLLAGIFAASTLTAEALAVVSNRRAESVMQCVGDILTSPFACLWHIVFGKRKGLFASVLLQLIRASLLATFITVHVVASPQVARMVTFMALYSFVLNSGKLVMTAFPLSAPAPSEGDPQIASKKPNVNVVLMAAFCILVGLFQLRACGHVRFPGL